MSPSFWFVQESSMSVWVKARRCNSCATWKDFVKFLDVDHAELSEKGQRICSILLTKNQR